jgi:predicted transcriptional regulator
MEHITISDFAEAVGVTPQAIYKRIKKDLSPYVKETPNGKLISTEALKLFDVEKQFNNQELRKEIERLTQENNELHQRFIEQNEKFLEILAIQAKQAENYQILLAQNQQLHQQLLNPPQPVEPINQDTISSEQVNKPSLLNRIFKRNPR